MSSLPYIWYCMNLHKVICFLSTFLLSATALATPYMIGQLGAGGFDFNNNPFSNVLENGHERHMNARLGAGYLWDVNERLKMGAESGFNRYAHIKEPLKISAELYSTHLSRWSLDGLAVVDFYTTPALDLFAKVGFAYINQKSSVEIDGYKLIHEEKRVVPKLALGTGYQLTPNLNAHLSLHHEFAHSHSKTVASVLSASALLIGVNYAFA